MSAAETAEPKAAVRQLFEAMNANDLDRLLALVTEDVTVHTPIPGVAPGREGFRAFMALFEHGHTREGTPSLHPIVRSMVGSQSRD